MAEESGTGTLSTTIGQTRRLTAGSCEFVNKVKERLNIEFVVSFVVRTGIRLVD